MTARCSSSIVFVFTTMTLLLQGCVSFQLPAENGRPRVIGFGYTKLFSSANGQVYRVITPGLSLRAYTTVPGVSLGWHETSLFYPAASDVVTSHNSPVAVRTKCLGIDSAPFHIMAGFEEVFAVPLPSKETSIIQLIGYSENQPLNTVIKRKEIK